MNDEHRGWPRSNDGIPFRSTWTDIFRSDTLVHLSLFTSIAAGVFQGYLKDRLGGALPYALADAAFIGAAFFWFAGLTIRRRGIVGPGAFPLAIVALIALPCLYLLVPNIPLPIELAGLRGWSEMPVACLIALTVVRTPGHVRAYVAWILILGVIAAVYGLRQYQLGPDAALGVSGLALERHGASVFYSIGMSGQREFRAFSTFQFPAPFAGWMVFGFLLSAGVVLTRSIARSWRLGALALLPLFFAGMTVSGTRAALVTLALGLVVIAHLRRANWRTMLLLPPLALAVHIGALLTSGRALSRAATLVLQEGQLWTYVLAPVTVAWRALQHAPFGLGLGRSGVGVPYRLVGTMPRGFFVGSDGDIGRAAVELGVFGLALLLVVIAYLLPMAYRATWITLDRGGEAEDVTLGAGALVLSTGALVLIGSPLSTTPHGVVWWFLLGAIVKLAMIRQAQGDSEDPATR
jgi:hypothetical protein